MTTLAKKLIIKPSSKWLFFNAPQEVSLDVLPLPEGASISSNIETGVDGILLFIKSKAELLAAMEPIAPALTPETIFWIAYPKKSAAMKSDLKMGDWDELTRYNLQGVASIAVNEIWAGSRFRPVGQAKISGLANAQLKTNEYAEYVDVINKVITLPTYLLDALQKNPTAWANYEALSYSNRKEYVLWLLTAKQEKTRLERLDKAIEKLSAGKKNPSEK
jgi:hypothetical protein